MTEYIHRVTEAENEKIAQFLRIMAIGTVLFGVAIVVLFVTAESWLKLFSPESERRFIEPYIELSQDTLLVQGDPELQTYVEALTKEIVSQLDDAPPITVQVIEGDTINAFATLGGYVFVFEGLIDAVENENALAMVLGHEIAHVYNRDPLLSLGRGLLIQLAISSVSGNGIDPDSINSGSDILLNTYSRDQELDADALALNLLHEKYGHAGGANHLFHIIDDGSDEVLEFLSTHPDTSARIEKIDETIRANNWEVGEAFPYPDTVRSALGLEAHN